MIKKKLLYKCKIVYIVIGSWAHVYVVECMNFKMSLMDESSKAGLFLWVFISIEIDEG